MELRPSGCVSFFFVEDDVMNKNETPGGAAPALAAHSKDVSAPGQAPASNTVGNTENASGVSEAVSGLSQMAHEGVERTKATVREASESARETLSEQGGHAVDQAADFIRQQPLVAVAVTSAICLMIGMLLGRR
jgi:ElaB/YqjD/DUF883 family membrane-anchored ribosome-binding protein